MQELEELRTHARETERAEREARMRAVGQTADRAGILHVAPEVLEREFARIATEHPPVETAAEM